MQAFDDTSLEPSAGPSVSPIELGFALVGHGTRQPVGQAQMRQVFDDFAAAVAPYPAELGFLELAEPCIGTALHNLRQRGVRRLITVPVLLFTAGHAERDIPEAVQAAAEEWGLESLDQTPSLQVCRPVIELSALRFREAVCQPCQLAGVAAELQPTQGSAVGGIARVACHGCTGEYCPQVGLLMIGRGSSSEEATLGMRHFTQERRRLTPTAWCETAFIHAQQPTVEEGLDQLAACGYPLAVVQPHLLFEGELIQTLRRQVAERAERHPQQRWIITETLGTDRRLGETLANIALERAGSQTDRLA